MGREALDCIEGDELARGEFSTEEEFLLRGTVKPMLSSPLCATLASNLHEHSRSDAQSAIKHACFFCMPFKLTAFLSFNQKFTVMSTVPPKSVVQYQL